MRFIAKYEALRASMMASGATMVVVAFAADWIGLGEPGSFGNGRILLLSVRIVVLLIGFMFRTGDAQNLSTLGQRVAEAYGRVAVFTMSIFVVLAVLELGLIGVSRIGT